MIPHVGPDALRKLAKSFADEDCLVKNQVGLRRSALVGQRNADPPRFAVRYSAAQYIDYSALQRRSRATHRAIYHWACA